MTRDEMFAYALTQPGAEDSTLHGGRCIRVRGHWIVNANQDPDALALALDLGTVAFLMETEPQTYFQTPHFEGWPGLMVRLDLIDDEELSLRIENAWRFKAPKRLAAKRPTAS